MADVTSYIYAGSAHVPSQSGTKNFGGLFRRAVGDDHWQALTHGLPEEAVTPRTLRPCTWVQPQQRCIAATMVVIPGVGCPMPNSLSGCRWALPRA